MWMMPLHLHVNQKSDYDDDDDLVGILQVSIARLIPKVTLMLITGFCLFGCFLSQSTAMVMSGRSVHLKPQFFLGKLD